VDHLAVRTPLAVVPPQTPAVQRVPAVVNDHLSPDMGRNGPVIALGRKNYLFAGSLEGGRRAAIIYTLVGTAELNGWDPQAYLRVLLDRIAEVASAEVVEIPALAGV
jgi:hypothetical protein